MKILQLKTYFSLTQKPTVLLWGFKYEQDTQQVKKKKREDIMILFTEKISENINTPNSSQHFHNT